MSLPQQNVVCKSSPGTDLQLRNGVRSFLRTNGFVIPAPDIVISVINIRILHL
jgi:hypothetical protein